MGLKENNLRAKYERTLTRHQRAWRCNSGLAWSGQLLQPLEALRVVGVKIMMLIKPRRVELWPKGTPDLIGFDSVEITPDMVGKRVAVFTGTELKASRGDKLRVEQERWRRLLVDMGGIHRVIQHDGSIVEKGFFVD